MMNDRQAALAYITAHIIFKPLKLTLIFLISYYPIYF